MSEEIRECQSCKQSFAIEPEDFAFYEKMKVPPPTWCPECRLMRRLMWRNERSLYQRSCSLCNAKIIAMYPADTPFPVYCRECWFSDKWDAIDYGCGYDFSRPFFEQFRDLLRVVPQIALQVVSSPDSKYVNQVANCKNCYLIVSGSDNEDCMYSYRILNSKNTIDSNFVRQVEYCYQCFNSTILSNSLFSDDCADSAHLSFCSDVRGSIDCFMSSNLRRKSYVFRNEELKEDEYRDRMKAIDTGSYSQLQAYRQEYEALRQTRIHKYTNEKNISSCTGHGIVHSSNSQHCFYSSNLENCAFMLMVADTKDSHDINNGCCLMELGYELSTAGVNLYNVMLSADVWPDVRDTVYSQSCRNDVSNLFGCVSLRKKKYCILNKQYSPAGYAEALQKIIFQMSDMPYVDKRGRTFTYGEFFPPELSIFAYNESAAQDYFPKSKDEAEALGFRWRDAEKKNHEITLDSSALPDHVKETPDTITKEVIGCLHHGDCNHQCPGAFRITSQELTFYRERTIALPRLCPNCRHYERFMTTNPYRLWKRRCQCSIITHPHGSSGCAGEFETSYAPDRPEAIYCEKCYQEEVI